MKLQIDPPKTENEPWKTLRADLDKIPKDAVFRFRKDGDRIRKFGGTTKSLKKYFNEKKIPVQEREWLPLIAQKDGNKVFAVCGVEIADELKVDENTARVLYIVLQHRSLQKNQTLWTQGNAKLCFASSYLRCHFFNFSFSSGLVIVFINFFA